MGRFSRVESERSIVFSLSVSLEVKEIVCTREKDIIFVGLLTIVD